MCLSLHSVTGRYFTLLTKAPGSSPMNMIILVFLSYIFVEQRLIYPVKSGGRKQGNEKSCKQG